MKEDKRDKRWWDLKLGGILPLEEETRAIFYGLIGIIILTVLYIASFYLKR